MPSTEQNPTERREANLPHHEVERRWQELMQHLQAIADRTDSNLIIEGPLLKEALFLSSEFDRLEEEES